MNTKTVKIRGAILAVLLLTAGACGGGGGSDDRTLEQKYSEALADASVAEPGERHSLIAIDPSNGDLIWDGHDPRRVLVSTMTGWSGYSEYVGREMEASRELWVTVVPEVQDFCRHHLRAGEDPVLRLEQLLGLNNRGRTFMVEFYADPADLFRPTPDPEIDDEAADLSFPIGVSPEHVRWFNDYMAVAYNPDGYPWTRLGYTCDWVDGACHVGPSEFVVRPGAVVQVLGVHQAADYCSADQP